VEERRQVLVETARELLASGDANGLRLILNSQHRADLADLVGQLDEEAQRQIFSFLAEPLAAAVLWTGTAVLGLCVGLAMFSAVVFSAVMGLLVPLGFRSFGVDPAVASGPLITTLNDVLALAIYFGIARVLLHLWG
jgi:Mg/Co/Ni transporter MgtE